ncbi:MAG TPA: zinc-binding dehydrogenase [Mycobacteriales bacterium]|nr:zinc-binding dehydrogenase [Mycobacteriales bacterium]
MRAARFDQTDRTLRVVDVPTPEPEPHEVLVRVQACGVCLSDVHLIDGSLPGSLPVVTPGHEPAGVIERLGSAVPHWQPGQRVLMQAGRTCRTCRHCAAGQPEHCEGVQIMGFGFDGAWADYVVVPATALVAVPDDVPIEQAAIIADAVSTPYAALLERAQVRPAESVGIWGVGGLGFHAVKLAHIMGAAPIIAVDPLEDARKRALSAGADIALDPADPELVAKVRAATDGGLDVALDVVGAVAVLQQAEQCLGRRGRLVMVGVSMEPTQLGPGALFSVQSQTLLGHLGYAKEHMNQLLRLVQSGRLDLSDSITDVVPLDEVVDAVDRLATKRDNPIRIVIKP